MSNYPEAKGQNGDTTFEDWATSMVQWVSEGMFLNRFMPRFVRGCLNYGQVEAALIAARGTSDVFDRIMGLAWVALHEGVGAEIAREVLDQWEELELPEFKIDNRSGREEQNPIIAGLLTVRAADRHGEDASRVAAFVEEGLEAFVEARANMSLILELFLDLDEIDEALNLHERLGVPWEEGIAKNNLTFDHPPYSISGQILGRLLREGRNDDAEALVARCEIDYPGDGMTSRGYSWTAMYLSTFASVPAAEVDCLRPMVERLDESTQMAAAFNILKRGASKPESHWYCPIKESVAPDELHKHIGPSTRLSLGDVEGWKEHFEPHEGQCYAFEKYRAGIWDVDEAISAVDAHYEKYKGHINPVQTLASLTHQALDLQKMDDAHRFLERAEAIIDEESARELTQYEEGMKNRAYALYGIAKVRTHVIEGDTKQLGKIQKALRKIASAQDQDVIAGLAGTELSLGFPQEAVKTAMKLKLKDRKEARGEVPKTVAAIVAYYLPEDVGGAFKTIEKVLGTPDAKVKVSVQALEHVCR